MTAPANRLWLKAQRYIAAKQYVAARITLEALIQSEPQHAMARVLLAGVILSEGRLREACAHLLEAAKTLPDNIDVICKLALALLRVGEVVAARACLDHPVVVQAVSAQHCAALAHVYRTLGDQEKALELINRASALGLDNAEFRYFRGVQLMFNGRNQEAEAEFETCLKQYPNFGRAALSRARIRKQIPAANHLDFIRRQLLSVERGTVEHAAFEFAQFKELDDLDDCAAAWAALGRGNAIMHARLQHDSEREGKLVDALIAMSTDAYVPSVIEHQGALPIFIIGLPRSGTTLLERILSNHSMVTSAGELDDFAHQLRWQADCNGNAVLDDTLLARTVGLDYANIGTRYLQKTQWRAQGKRYFVDKLPANYLLAGFIGRALPQAPILHMARDPMDTCFSNYKALFGDACAYSYHLPTLAVHYRQYQRLMQHWHAIMPGRILDVPYAALVNDPASTVREVLAFCDLPFEHACMDISSNRTPVATLSTTQVREAIHTRAVGEWQRYERELSLLRAAIVNADLSEHL